MYKAEFFTDQFVFVEASFFSQDTEISLDFLTFDATTITFPIEKTKVKKGHICRVASGVDVVMDGVVSDVQPGDGTVDISVRPIVSICEVQTFVTAPISDVAAWLYAQIEACLVSNSDSLQNRPVVLSNTVVSGIRPITVEGTTVVLTDIIADALTTYGIVVDCSIDMASKKIVVIIHTIEESKTIEADLENVISKEITLGDSYGSTNKAVIRKISTNSDTGVISVLQTKSYYLHPDGTVTDVDANRITPVFYAMEDMETSDTWDADALAKAKEMLTPEQYDNEICLTYVANDKISRPSEMSIGTIATIYIGGNAYKSILTGKTISNGTITLLFGAVRIDLTKKLILERRKNK